MEKNQRGFLALSHFICPVRVIILNRFKCLFSACLIAQSYLENINVMYLFVINNKKINIQE